jgi:transcriptional regulator with XRE-family HTH domain
MDRMDMNISAKLGMRLKMIRIAAGIKQKDLSKAFNIPASLLSMYEKGSREPSLKFLENFTKYFNIPLSQLFVLMEEDATENDEAASILNKMKIDILRLEKESLRSRIHVI